MKLRIKYAKTGSLKFIGHLDVMRYFQKAIRRAGLDVAYSNGFSPHQLITFAAPLGLGVTSEGEYFDGEFYSVSTTKDMVERLNAVMAEGMDVLDVRLLGQQAKTAMAAVCASDYLVSIREGYYQEESNQLFEKFSDFLKQEHIEVLKKTKKNEQMTDIRGMILEAYVTDNPHTAFFEPGRTPEGTARAFYMKLSAGSNANLKPELLMDAYVRYLGFSYIPFGFQVHRLETYMEGEKGDLLPLIEAGSVIDLP